jgi:putative aldouronate transport system permease protein
MVTNSSSTDYGASSVKSTHVPKHTAIWKKIVKFKVLYVMFLPVLVYFILLRYWPILLSFIVAFKDFKIGAGVFSSKWIALENFRAIFSDPDLLRVIGNTLEISVLRLVIGFLPPIILAIMFHDMAAGKFSKISQTLMYIPHFFSWVIIYGIVFAFFSTGTGFVNDVLQLFGVKRVDFLLSSNWFRPILIGSGLWKELGWGTIIYMAAMSTIDKEQFEAAKIDGAGPIRRIVHITFPSILPVISFVLCINLGFILYAGGEQILMFYNSAVYDVADVIDTWSYRVGLGTMRYGVGTAIGLFQSMIGLIIVLITNYLSKRFTGNGIW